MNKELFRKRFREVVLGSGMSQTELARRVKIHPSTLQKYFRGDCLPSPNVILRMWKLLKFDMSYLLGEK